MIQETNAYNAQARIASYDADMDIMHPNRAVMAQTLLELVPFSRSKPLQVLELGTGTGYFTGQLMTAFPLAEIIAVDGAQAMQAAARSRLGAAFERIQWRTGNFRDLKGLLRPEERGDLVLSAYALHHCSAQEKHEILSQIVAYLKPGGWFLNADLIRVEGPLLAQRVQDLRIEGIRHRAPKDDLRFRDVSGTQSYLERLEREDGDQPLTLSQDLQILSRSGLRESTVFWCSHREAITGGVV